MNIHPHTFGQMIALFTEHSFGEVRPYQSPSPLAEKSFTSQEFDEFESGEATYSLHLLNVDPQSLHPDVFTDPEALFGTLVSFPEIGVGHADGEVQWKHGPDWIAARARFVARDNEATEIVFTSVGLRKLDDDTYALLVWGPGKEKFATVFGFDAWTEAGWKTSMIEYPGSAFLSKPVNPHS